VNWKFIALSLFVRGELESCCGVGSWCTFFLEIMQAIGRDCDPRFGFGIFRATLNINTAPEPCDDIVGRPLEICASDRLFACPFYHAYCR